MQMKKMILLMLLCVLPLYSFADGTVQEIKYTGRWTEIKRSIFTPEIPISGKVSNGLLILTNERPDRDITVTLTDCQGSIIIRKEFPKENTSYIVIPLDELQKSETYTVTLTSTIPSDYLYATINL